MTAQAKKAIKSGTKSKRLLILLAGVGIAIVIIITHLDWITAKLYLFMLEPKSRIEYFQFDRLVKALDIKPGQKIADIGAGTGLFSFLFAKHAGDSGRVYAVDVMPLLLANIDETARKKGIATIRTVRAGDQDPRLPEPVDLAFICETLHYIDNPPQYLRTLRRYIKPGGRVAIIHIRMLSTATFTVRDLDIWMDSAGFRKEASYDFYPRNYFEIYRER